MRFALHLLAGLGVAAALASCGPPPEAELKGDIVVNGMEPAFWGLRVDRTANTATLSIAGEEDAKVSAPTVTDVKNGVVTMTSKTPAGDFVMTLKRESCLDGLDNAVEYAWSVTAPWKGETLKGCARKAGSSAPKAQ